MALYRIGLIVGGNQPLATTVPGRYFLTNASHFFSASLTRDNSGLVLHVENFTEPFRHRHFERSQPLAGLPTKLTFPDGSIFEALSDDGLLAILGARPSFFDILTRHERSVKTVVATLVITVALAFGFWRWGLSTAAFLAAWMTPPTFTYAMDAGTLATLDRALLSPSKLSDDQKARITSDFDRLATVSGLPMGRLTLVFRDAPRLGANAFALPGGSVILTDQLASLSREPDEIAGVLAHEIGHVEHRHSLRLIYQAVGLSFFITMISGDPGSMIDTVIQQMSSLQTLAYSREFEREADRESTVLMQKLGRNPLALITLLDRVVPQGAGQTTSFLSTHPGNEERRGEVEALASSEAVKD